MEKVEMNDIVNLAKNRGFVYAGSEIYGGLANAWDYGPYGAMMKENIKNLWIKEFVQKKDDMVLLDSAILMNPQIWVASGHVGGFSDPLVDCKSCKRRFRADKIIEENKKMNPEWLEINQCLIYIKDQLLNITSQKIKDIKLEIDDMKEMLIDAERFWFIKDTQEEILERKKSLEKWIDAIKEILEATNLKNINEQIETFLWLFFPCPECGEKDWWKIQNFNLMFKTFQWVTEDSTTEIYLRPETAQGIFVNFANIARTSRKKIPFGVAQVGKAFRNEITPGNFIFRTREFEQMEIEYFCEPWKDLEEHAKWKQDCMNFLTKKIGLKEDSLKFRDHDKDELSHYSNATTDIEFRFPFGWGELWGIADRTDFDLKAHMRESKQDMSYFDPVNNKKYIPYVIEPSVWLTRLFLATMIDAYTTDGEGEEARTYLKLDPKIAPVKVWVLPVVKKISDIAKPIFQQLSEDFVCEYDDVGSIGKRYARFDEIGTPFCVTIDSENYDNGKVTVRLRDSKEQELVEISKLNEFIRKSL